MGEEKVEEKVVEKRIARLKRDGKDVCREPRFHPHFFSPIRWGRKKILSSLGGFPKIGGMNKEGKGEVI